MSFSRPRIFLISLTGAIFLVSLKENTETKKNYSCVIFPTKKKSSLRTPSSLQIHTVYFLLSLMKWHVVTFISKSI